MRSLTDLLRHYTAVNDPEGPRFPLRFGALVLLVAAGVAVLFLAAGDGPYTAGPALGAHDGADDQAVTEGVSGAEGIVVVPTSEGRYIGYPEATPAGDIDADALRDVVALWLLENPGHTAEPVERDGVRIGYHVRSVV